MNSSMVDNHYREDYKNYNKLKFENEKLHDQNNKLITKLEQITCEFSKSQNKIKELELQNFNTKGINGNLNSIWERNKALEEDNKNLCEELKFQLKSNKSFEIPDKKTIMENNGNINGEIETIKLASDKKMMNLKNQIQELRKQLLKTQQLAYKNECSYKMSQIETLEALKNCKLEKDCLVEKNLHLETKVKNIINIHSENLEMKTILHHTQNNLKVLKSDFDNLKLKQGESTKIFDREKKAFENQLSVFQQKNDDLLQENQILLSSIDKLTKSENAAKLAMCPKCENYSNKLAESHKQIEVIESQLHRLQEDKLKTENDFLSQNETFDHFEQEQSKLKEEINHLNGLKLCFDASIKLKQNEIDNLTSQLESRNQRLELREQRIEELSNQLSLKITEEQNLKSKFRKITEKLNYSETEVSKYINELTQIQTDKNRLSDTIINLEQNMSDKIGKIDQLTLKLNQTLSSNNQLEESLQFHLSNADTKIRDYVNNITDLKGKVEELNYSVNIYEKQNQCLKNELKEIKLKLEKLINNEVKLTEGHQLEIDRYQVQLAKNQELVETSNSEIKDKDCKIHKIESERNELHLKLMEKTTECEHLSKTVKDITEELSNNKKQLLLLEEQLKTHQNYIETIQNLKSKLSIKSIKIHSQEATIAELKQKLETINQELMDQKQNSEILKSQLIKVENCLEKLKVKASCSQENFDHKHKVLENVIKSNEIEYEKLSEKYRFAAKESDDLSRKLRENDEMIIRFESELKRNKEEISNLQQITDNLKDDIIIKEKAINESEKKISTLHEYLKCSQLNVVDKSREIDRLEQLVRDRSEQIEIRSNQLQDFEKDLEKRLIEGRKQIEDAIERESNAKTETENLNLKNKELSNILDAANVENRKLMEAITIREHDYNLILDQLKKLEKESKGMANKIKFLTNDSESKTMTIKDLTVKNEINESKIDKFTDDLESKVANLKGKTWQIRQLEEQIKKDKINFTNIEAELQTEIKLLMKKLNSFNSDKKKEMEFLMKNLSNRYRYQLGELVSFKQLTEKLNSNLDEVNIKLFEKEEHISELKTQINTQSMVMVDMENNYRLKEAVIEKLLQKINDLTLMNWSNETNDKILKEEGIKAKVNELEKQTNNMYEDITLENLLMRINLRLNTDNKMNSKE